MLGERPNSHGRTLTGESYVMHGILPGTETRTLGNHGCEDLAMVRGNSIRIMEYRGNNGSNGATSLLFGLSKRARKNGDPSDGNRSEHEDA